ncbi:hypothetical protein J6590_012440 [Homalodisca vitripennis]|nr:hypothetical protein J6590_012440 [Homalodisca vitripennis]
MLRCLARGRCPDRRPCKVAGSRPRPSLCHRTITLAMFALFSISRLWLYFLSPVGVRIIAVSWHRNWLFTRRSAVVSGAEGVLHRLGQFCIVQRRKFRYDPDVAVVPEHNFSPESCLVWVSRINCSEESHDCEADT